MHFLILYFATFKVAAITERKWKSCEKVLINCVRAEEQKKRAKSAAAAEKKLLACLWQSSRELCVQRGDSLHSADILET